MKTLFLIVALLAHTLSGVSQHALDSLSHPATAENLKWLTTFKHADKAQQLKIIQDRFFERSTNTDDDDLPVLIIDGIPVNANDKTRYFFLNSLTVDNVDIQVLDKEPEGLYIDKRFTGLIVITITDKRTRRKFKRLT